MAELDYTDEEWRTIPDAPSYSVSNFGRVRRDVPGLNKRPGKMLKPFADKAGYLAIDICENGGRRKGLINRLVLLAFIGDPPTPEHQAAHGNGSRNDNRLSNLRWATKKENWADKRLHGTAPDYRGEKGPGAKLTEQQVREIRAEPRYNGMRAVLSARYGVSQGAINSIRTKGKVWRHI